VYVFKILIFYHAVRNTQAGILRVCFSRKNCVLVYNLRMRSYKTWFVFLIIVALSACGFHLRGNYQLPSWLKTVYIQDMSASNLGEQLRRGLHNLNVQASPSRDTATAVIVLDQAQFSRAALTLDTTTGRPSMYAVGLTTRYRIINVADNTTVHGNFNDTLNYQFDAVNIPVNDVKEQELRETLVQSATDDIVRRLARMGTNAG
jgi:LPS-assembly lipoprotein